MKSLNIALVYNAAASDTPELPGDTGGIRELRKMIRAMARVLRSLKHRVTVVPLDHDMLVFQRKLRRLRPDVVFNQYDDVVSGALYEMRVAALLRMMGFRITGAPSTALGICRHKYTTATLLQGEGIPIPPQTKLIFNISEARRHRWVFPVIVQAVQEHAGIGLDRDSVVYSKKALAAKVRQVVHEFNQPALVQSFIRGREFSVGIIGGRRMRVLPLAEVNYSNLPEDIPPIMSYAAKWMENSVEYRKTSVICPAVVDPELGREIGRVAIRAFRAVGGMGYGRVDVRIDDSGVPRILDVNCNPSLDEGVALARSAEKAGIPYARLLQIIIDAALEGLPFDADLPMI